MSMGSGPARRRMGAAFLIGAASLLLLFVLEGMAGIATSVRILSTYHVTSMDAEQVHAEYDSLLGWINKPDLALPDLYGPGARFTTNAQRFRADRPYPEEVPAGVVRIICSGDSFTMGHSVADEQAWCPLLESAGPRLETINMGMAAYGVDQAYLWYRRDGVRFDHQIHIFAFITPDFDRMRSDNFGGYPKPVLRFDGDSLRIENVPVPERFAGIPRAERTRQALQNLHVVRIGLAALRRLGMEPRTTQGTALDDDEVRAAASAIFEHLRDLNAAKGSVLVLVFLPRSGDSDDRRSADWRRFVSAEAERLGVVFIDLVAEFQRLPVSDAEQFFVRPYQPSHYNAHGNAWVARQLFDRLAALPQTRALLAGDRSPMH